MKIIAKNEGKRFEECFIKSVDKLDYVWHKRLNDNASSWSGGNNTRFASTNECDFLLFDCNTRTLSALELKSTIGSLTYWREDFEEKGRHQNFNIKESQINGMKKWNKYLMNCGFIFNFRNTPDNTTYFVMLDDFLDYTSTLSKKSINIHDVEKMNPIKITSEQLRTNYRYDIRSFLSDIQL